MWQRVNAGSLGLPRMCIRALADKFLNVPMRIVKWLGLGERIKSARTHVPQSESGTNSSEVSLHVEPDDQVIGFALFSPTRLIILQLRRAKKESYASWAAADREK